MKKALPLLFLIFSFGFITNTAADTLFLSSDGSISNLDRTAPLKRTLRAAMRSSSQLQYTITGVMDSLGYLDHRLWSRAPDTLALLPGRRYEIETIEISSNSDINSDQYIPSLPRPFDWGEVTALSSKITRKMAQSGYPYSRVVASFQKCSDDENSGVCVLLEVDSDHKTRFWAPLIYGETKNPDLYSREIRIKEGEVFDIRRIEDALGRLEMRPYVLSATIEPPLIIESGEEFDDSLKKVVVPFIIHERSGMDLEGALGFQSGSSSSLRGSFNLSLINVFNQGEVADIHYSGNRVLQDFNAAIRKPWVFGLPLNAGLKLGIEIEEAGYGFMSGEINFDADVGSRILTGVAFHGSETVHDTSGRWTFFGTDLFLKRTAHNYRRGVQTGGFSVKTGTGFAKREKLYTRSRVELNAALQVPLFDRQAIILRLNSKNLITNEETLAPAEMYRVGGHQSIRGYSDNEFAFKNVMYGQLEYLYYFNDRASVFIFLDAGAGLDNDASFDFSKRRVMMGYGAGVRFPARGGMVSVEWARNYKESHRGGRVHVGVKNRF
ncbi:BamA/TamA family outer membrane protein [Chitinispirillales bacterium ANBcel5]|uniref:BamA/TamA family outer membrane protein n=1 Tax=Cellulosispirillum alkaliphilum TaxID=3039283 RepID=UPI002A53C547|nr:BamA/TamA family outer membrane protein [Chitinispirillales bacterium ANBcel5]